MGQLEAATVQAFSSGPLGEIQGWHLASGSERGRMAAVEGGGGGALGPGGVAGAWRGRGDGRGSSRLCFPPADEPAAWSAALAAAAAAGLPEVGPSPEDALAPSSPSHPAPSSDPTHPRSPDPAWASQREHDVRTPKELSAGGQKKQRLGEQSERAAGPRLEGELRAAARAWAPGGAPARKAAVVPGPWKVPGSDKLPGLLQPGASAAGR